MSRRDEDRLNWLADNQIVEGFANLEFDLHDYASQVFYDSGEAVAEQDAYRIAIRKLIDTAMAADDD